MVREQKSANRDPLLSVPKFNSDKPPRVCEFCLPTKCLCEMKREKRGQEQESTNYRVQTHGLVTLVVVNQ